MMEPVKATAKKAADSLNGQNPVVKIIRTVMLAAIGAVALSKEEIDQTTGAPMAQTFGSPSPDAAVRRTGRSAGGGQGAIAALTTWRAAPPQKKEGIHISGMPSFVSGVYRLVVMVVVAVNMAVCEFIFSRQTYIDDFYMKMQCLACQRMVEV